MDGRVSIPFEGRAMEAVDYEVGAAVAMKIVATSPLSRDRALRAYVSMVGTALVEQTPYYDEPFVFLVIESPLVRSFSTPGGYVFITTGALAVMRDEAALAGVLAHEIVHVVERHGIKELGKQAQRIKSSTMMDTLDAEVDQLGMDTGDRRVAAELDAMTDQMYEHIIGGRKRADEDTSDRLGTMVLYNTGYTATGIADFLAAAARAGEAGGSDAYRSADERIGLINKLIKQKYMTNGSRRNNADRFMEFVRVR
jgi:predicted Zn-dependent protease